MFWATPLRRALIFPAFIAVPRMSMNPTYLSERRGAADVRHAVCVTALTFSQSVKHQKLCRETFRPKENLHATRNPKWRNPRSSLIWGVFSQTTEDLSERLSDAPINKLLENCYSVTDVCGYHPLSRSEPVHLWMSFKLFTDSLQSPWFPCLQRVLEPTN